MKHAVHPKDPRSLPRALVWMAVLGIVGPFAYQAWGQADTLASQRTHVVKEKTSPVESSSALAKSVSERAPILLNEREQYASLGKEGLGIIPEVGKNEVVSSIKK